MFKKALDNYESHPASPKNVEATLGKYGIDARKLTSQLKKKIDESSAKKSSGCGCGMAQQRMVCDGKVCKFAPLGSRMEPYSSSKKRKAPSTKSKSSPQKRVKKTYNLRKK
jgi:hypothetical protein